jgi:hypothetical protein
MRRYVAQKGGFFGVFFEGGLGKVVDFGWFFVVTLWCFCGEVVVPCWSFLHFEKMSLS